MSPSDFPELIAGRYVLLRLVMPRHPPTALNYLTVFFLDEELLQASIFISENRFEHSLGFCYY